MLILSIKKKWYDMILSGEKKEEYREIKPYYVSRFRNWIGKNGLRTLGIGAPIMFRNGYNNNSPSFIAICQLSKGPGKLEWGATPGKEYYVLKILEITDVKNS